MLSFDIRALEAQAESVDGELSPNDAIWEDGDPLPRADPRRGPALGAGAGRFYFSGRIEGTATGVPALPDRTLAAVAVDSHLIFAEAGD
jgi:uncharacterized protein